MPGQVLAELDKDNLAAQVREARAALSGSQANLKAAKAELEKTKSKPLAPTCRLPAAIWSAPSGC